MLIKFRHLAFVSVLALGLTSTASAQKSSSCDVCKSLADLSASIDLVVVKVDAVLAHVTTLLGKSDGLITSVDALSAKIDALAEPGGLSCPAEMVLIFADRSDAYCIDREASNPGNYAQALASCRRAAKSLCTLEEYVAIPSSPWQWEDFYHQVVGAYSVAQWASHPIQTRNGPDGTLVRHAVFIFSGYISSDDATEGKAYRCCIRR
jgi:hypothetical protein